ncbi:MAG: 50S ribosomal protein L10 [Actinomycetia bacterium]|nr:50S ribosomal protein L10 [Actinomycetes bacterium]
MPRAAKAAIVAETAEMLDRAQAVVLASYRQLSVSQMNRLRNELAKGGVRMKVVKNTLIRRAADQVGVTGLEPYLTGPTVLFVSNDDPTAPARLLQSFQREYRTVEIKAGVLDKKAIGADMVRALASLPPREQLLGQLVGTLAAPIQRLAGVLNAPIAGLVRALAQIRDQKPAEA